MVADVSSQFEFSLSKICEGCPQVADEVIDLHLGQRGQCPAGRCACALFTIANEAGDLLPDEVSTIFAAVKPKLCVKASSGSFAQQLPFNPQPGENLEGFCRRMMDVFFWDRALPPGPLRLCFSYQ